MFVFLIDTGPSLPQGLALTTGEVAPVLPTGEEHRPDVRSRTVNVHLSPNLERRTGRTRVNTELPSYISCSHDVLDSLPIPILSNNCPGDTLFFRMFPHSVAFVLVSALASQAVASADPIQHQKIQPRACASVELVYAAGTTESGLGVVGSPLSSGLQKAISRYETPSCLTPEILK